jgi:hypothetical protein
MLCHKQCNHWHPRKDGVGVRVASKMMSEAARGLLWKLSCAWLKLQERAGEARRGQSDSKVT